MYIFQKSGLEYLLDDGLWHLEVELANIKLNWKESLPFRSYRAAERWIYK